MHALYGLGGLLTQPHMGLLREMRRRGLGCLVAVVGGIAAAIVEHGNAVGKFDAVGDGTTCGAAVEGSDGK